MGREQRAYVPALSGVRAYGFLLVFAVHYAGSSWTLRGHGYAAYPWLLGCQLSFAALPMFFALSGYLITGILFDSRAKQGFFRVFYLRRALRVLPLYYVILALLAVFLVVRGHGLLWRQALFLVYLQNFWPGSEIYHLTPLLYIGHLWSLALEEQFYLVWPVVVWCVRGRRNLLRVCYGVVMVAFLARLLFPLLHMQDDTAYQNTLFRCDAVMLGAALALHERGPMGSMARLGTAARWVAGLACGFLLTRALLVGQALPFRSFGVAVITPVLSLLGTSMLILAVTPGTALHFLCERRWAVRLGEMSYAMYVIHQILAPVFLQRIIPRLAGSGMGLVLAQLAGMAAAMMLTYGLSVLARVAVEEPMLRLKRHVRYGGRRAEPEKERAVVDGVGVRLPVDPHLGGEIWGT